jgi:hypothetical protein
MKCRALILISALLFVTSGGSAQAAPISASYVGTWSTSPGSGQPGSGTDLETGQKFVINVTYDTAVTPISSTTSSGFTYYTVDLAAGAAPPNGGGLVSNGNSLDILIPLEGMDAGSPFIYSSDEFDHGDFPGDPFPSAVPQIHFLDAAGTQFLGFKLESFDFGPGGNFVQLATEVANQGGHPTPSTVVDMISGGFQTVIRSVNHLEQASSVVAEAGNALTYDAGNLTVTTDGGTFRNGDGTWQDNDLGAARTDKEDFLTHTWTNLGSVQGGAAGALVGTDAEALRPNIIVDAAPSGTRAVEDVNKIVGIANSGLQSTTDVATFRIAVTEDLTGFSGGTDTVSVSYNNAGPTATVGPDITYSASNLSQTAQGGVIDADLAVNAVVAGFESHAFEWSEGGGALPGSPSANPNLLVNILNSGLTNTLDTTTFDITVTDLAGASDSNSILVSYQNSDVLIALAIATPVGNDIQFDLDIQDADLAVNDLGLVDFELITTSFLLDGGAFVGLAELLATGTEYLTETELIALFGLGAHALEVRTADRFRTNGGTFQSAFINFTVVPEPGTATLLGLGLIGFSLASRRRGVARNGANAPHPKSTCQKTTYRR